MTEAANIERRKTRQTGGQVRRQKALFYEAIYQELAEAGLKDEAWHDLDAVEAVFKKLNAVDEAEAARRDLCG
jgi:hypothetical protein